MIDSIESNFRRVIDSLKAQIFDIEYGKDSAEEKRYMRRPYFDELDEYEIQRCHARNKLVICIYSICEASLAEICTHYKVPLKFSPQNTSKKDYYLSDYLFSIGTDYTTKDNTNSSYVVYHAIRELRNNLTHDAKRVSEAVSAMKSVGFSGIENHCGTIQIKSAELLYEILVRCSDMLLTCEHIAKQRKSKK